MLWYIQSKTEYYLTIKVSRNSIRINVIYPISHYLCCIRIQLRRRYDLYLILLSWHSFGNNTSQIRQTGLQACDTYGFRESFSHPYARG